MILTSEEIDSAITDLPHWKLVGILLVGEFQFISFAHTIEFVNMVAQISNDKQHFPTMTVTESTVTLQVQSESGITNLDLELIQAIEDEQGRFIED